jgi:amino acid adenylation domain-containing protein
MVRAPHARHDAGLPLSPADHQQVLVEWNAAPEPACGEALIHRWIAARAAERPTAPAVEHQARSLSYAELERLAGALARRLRELGAGPDVLVGLCVERSCDMIVGILGILQAGAAYLPLDPGYPPQRVAFLLQDAGSGIVVTEGRLAERFAAPSIRLVLLDALPDTGTPAEPLLDTGVTPDNLAYVIYTSGSTGRPKGVQVTHRTLVASTAARLAYYREPVERFLLLSSSAFDSSVAGIFGTLCQGGTLLLPPQEAERDPQLIVAQVATRHASHLLALPSLYSLVLEEEGKPLGSLRAVIVAGEACPADLVARHVSALRETALYNEYGPTEATVWCSVHDAASPQRSERVPIGRTIPGARLYVLDPFGSPSPVGAPGELWVGGCGVARGYLHRPELTAERFLPDPYSADPGARQYRTGDVARWLPDGTLEFLGRRDHQVKVRGFRIELEEVEATLGQHPGVREAVVLARRDGGAEPRLAAYVVAGEPAPTGGALRTFLRQRLPEYMVPAYFLFLASLPLNPNGKLDRAALPAPGSDRPELDRDYAPPRDEVERTLAAVWQEQLGLEKVGIHDNFFELGGSSLLMIQTHRRQRAVLGVELTLADMFQSPTIADLAARIQQAGSTGPSLQASQERATARKTSADQISRARELRLNAKRR